MSAALEFFFDFISPNAYLAWQDIGEIAARHDRTLLLRPVLFAGLLHAFDQRGPAELEPKLQWMQRNCLRKARDRGIALRAPASHPFNPLLALRVCSMIDDADQCERATAALFRAVWAQARDVSDADTVTEVLNYAGCDGAVAVSRAAAPDARTRLRAQTDAAISRGVFGVPTVIVDDELFFGYDDLRWLQRHLAGDDPIDRQELTRWQQVRPSARRRGS